MDIEIVNEYLSYNLIKKDKVISSIKVKDSTIDSYDIKINKDYNYYFPSDFDKTLISYEYDGIGEISSDNNVNDFIGVVNIYYNTKLIDSINLYLNKTIYKSKTEEVLKNTWSALLKLISLLGVIIIIILAIIVIIMLKFKSVKVQSINEDQLRYILKQIETNKGMMHGYSKGKKVYFKIIKLDTKQMKVTLKKLK